jgi:cell division septation protein DedD
MAVRRQRRAYVAIMSVVTLLVLVAVLWFLWDRFGPVTRPAPAAEPSITQTEVPAPSVGLLPAAGDSAEGASTVEAQPGSDVPSAAAASASDTEIAEQGEPAGPTAEATESVETPTATFERTSPPSVEDVEGPYAWIVASVIDRAEADERVASLRSLGYDAEVVRATVNGTSRYRIAIGRYPTPEDAVSSRVDLPPGSSDAWVTRVR